MSAWRYLTYQVRAFDSYQLHSWDFLRYGTLERASRKCQPIAGPAEDNSSPTTDDNNENNEDVMTVMTTMMIRMGMISIMMIAMMMTTDQGQCLRRFLSLRLSARPTLRTSTRPLGPSVVRHADLVVAASFAIATYTRALKLNAPTSHQPAASTTFHNDHHRGNQRNKRSSFTHCPPGITTRCA